MRAYGVISDLYSMNPDIAKLYQIAQKPQRLIIGLMSGTSVDGLDVALCRMSGSGLQTKVELLQFETVPFEAAFKAAIKAVFSKKEVNLELLSLLNPAIALHHAAIINDCLAKWGIANKDIDVIASHGQTIYHAPKTLHGLLEYGNATLQIGDGDHLAVATGIITLSDFRQKHIAAGGEGAPLAVYGDYLIFGKSGEDRILLNIGGIANFTYLPGKGQGQGIFSTDVGPGNTMMDALVQEHYLGQYFDADAAIAQQGSIHEGLLAALKVHPFFEAPFPKTTGPELFNLAYLQQAMQAAGATDLPVVDQMATLSRFSADMIVLAMRQCIAADMPVKVYASGGGMHNPLLMQHIQSQLPHIELFTTADLQIHPDAKEAVLFAALANECLAGQPDGAMRGAKGHPQVLMGKISLPA